MDSERQDKRLLAAQPLLDHVRMFRAGTLFFPTARARSSGSCVCVALRDCYGSWEAISRFRSHGIDLAGAARAVSDWFGAGGRSVGWLAIGPVRTVCVVLCVALTL